MDNQTIQKFEISHLDHVAIRVKNMDETVKWYSRVLGLKRVKTPKWGAFPVFMLAGKTGIAIFPASNHIYPFDRSSKSVKIDHFAFFVDNTNFEKAQDRFKRMKVSFQFQDHHYLQSIYLNDPDGHVVELTTMVTEEADFYNKKH